MVLKGESIVVALYRNAAGITVSFDSTARHIQLINHIVLRNIQLSLK